MTGTFETPAFTVAKKVSGTFYREGTAVIVHNALRGAHLSQDACGEYRHSQTFTQTDRIVGRPQRAAMGALVYHVLKRTNARLPIFEKDEEYAAFERVAREGRKRYDGRILAYCFMPHHWHVVMWPKGGWRYVALHGLDHPDSHPALARSLGLRWFRASLPGASQILFHSAGPSFSDCVSLCRAQCFASVIIAPCMANAT